MQREVNKNTGAVLNFVSKGKVVSIVGDLYTIKLIMKTRELFWLRYPVEWNDEY